MKNILVLPLDERPCNYNYIKKLKKSVPHNIILPDKNILSNKKEKGNIEEIKKWILKFGPTCDYFILSVDMLVYGGLIPSRLHHSSLEELIENLDVLKKLKKINKKIKIFAFNAIMRNPCYSSSDEEPDYYEKYGEKIFTRGKLSYKKNKKIISPDEKNLLNQLIIDIPEEIYSDYLHRRSLNVNINKKVVDFRNENIIESLVIPQDDSAPYGLTKLDQEEVIKHIKSLRAEEKVNIYPGSDELMVTFLGKTVQDIKNDNLLIYVHYRDTTTTNLIPVYEDRAVELSIKAQIKSSGCLITEDYNDADIILFINNPSTEFKDILSHKELYKNYNISKLNNFVNSIKKALIDKKTVAVADIYFGNGGDENLVKAFKDSTLLLKIHSYAGWNTSSNTLGTAIGQGIIFHYDKSFCMDNLIFRYTEDVIYQKIVRQYIINNVLNEKYTYFDVQEKEGYISKKVLQLLQQNLDNLLDNETESYKVSKCILPWQRIFEIDVDVEKNISYVIGVDVGGTEIKAGIVDTSGNIKNMKKIKTYNANCEKIVSDIKSLIKDLISIKKIEAIGIATAGRVNPNNGQIVYATDNLKGFTGLKLKEILEEEFCIPVAVDNDVNGALMGEFWKGIASLYESSVFISLGTGVGGACIYDKKLIYGATYEAFEIGHLVLVKDGLKCNCGKNGCVEQYVSGSALTNLGKKYINSNITNGKEVIDLFSVGEKNAKKVMEIFTENLSLLLDNIYTIMCPELIIIGGGVSETIDQWWSLVNFKYKDKVSFATLKNKAGIVGGGKLAFNVRRNYNG